MESDERLWNEEELRKKYGPWTEDDNPSSIMIEQAGVTSRIISEAKDGRK